METALEEFSRKTSENCKQTPKIMKSKASYAPSCAGDSLQTVIKDEVSECSIRRFEALKTLSELLYNPIAYARAVHEFLIVKTLEDAFFECFPNATGRTATFDLIVECFVIISSRFDGATAMMKQFNLIDAIYEMILCNSTVSCLGSKILKNLSGFPLISQQMVYYNHLEKLLKVFNNAPTANEDEDLFIHLAQMIYVDPNAAMTLGYFNFLLDKIVNKSFLLKIRAKCFALLLQCEKGQKAAERYDVVKTFYDILSEMDYIDFDAVENIVLVLQNATFTDYALWRSREFANLPHLLIRTAYNQNNSRLQLYSLRALRNITTMPSVKNYVRRVCKRKIMDINCLSEQSEAAKTDLLFWLRSKAYMNVNKSSNEILED